MSVWIVMVFGMCKRHSSTDKNVNAISKLLCKKTQTATVGLMFWLKQKFRKKNVYLSCSTFYNSSSPLLPNPAEVTVKVSSGSTCSCFYVILPPWPLAGWFIFLIFFKTPHIGPKRPDPDQKVQKNKQNNTMQQHSETCVSYWLCPKLGRVRVRITSIVSRVPQL